MFGDGFARMSLGIRPLVLLTLIAGLLSSRGSAWAQTAASVQPAASRWAPYYGFQPLEIYRVTERASNLLAADMNADGRTDLVLIDNSHSRLDVFVQRDPRRPLPPARPPGVNEIPDDRRLEHVKISVDVEVASLAVGDFDADGRTDVAYLGLPDLLVVRLQPESGPWSQRLTLRLPDIEAAPWIVTAGRFADQDRDEIIVLGKRETFRVRVGPANTLQIRQRLLNTSQKLALAMMGDIDGDARRDLVYMATEAGEERIVAARLQQADGLLGPELRFDLQQPRAMSLADVDGRDGVELLALPGRMQRVKAYRFRPASTSRNAVAQRLLQFGVGQPSRERDLAVGDIDGDGLQDVVVTDPAVAEVIVYRQRPRLGLDLGTAFPSFADVSHVRLAALNGDARADVVVLSRKEKAIGLSRWQDGRLNFPAVLPVRDEPVALEVADVDGDRRPEILYVTRNRADRKREFTLRMIDRIERDGQPAWREQPLPPASTAVADATGKKDAAGDEGEAAVVLPLRAPPSRLMAVDANRDGALDVLVFPDIEQEPILVLQGPRGWHVEQGGGGLRFGDLPPSAVFSGELAGGPVLLATHRQFVRSMQYRDGGWVVLDQFNVADSQTRLVGCATLELDGRPGNELVMIDAGIKKLRVYRVGRGQPEAWQEIELGEFPYLGTRVADLNGDRRPDLLLAGQNKFAVLFAGHGNAAFEEVASFERPEWIKRAFFMDVVAGDINGDRRKDVCVIDAAEHSIFVLAVVPTTSEGPTKTAERTKSQKQDEAKSAAEDGANAGSRPDASRDRNQDVPQGAEPAEPSFRFEYALRFPVFEAKSFSRETEFELEPREAVIADVTGDGRNDLVLLVHDRLLVYPQDPGTQNGSNAHSESSAAQGSDAAARGSVDRKPRGAGG